MRRAIPVTRPWTGITPLGARPTTDGRTRGAKELIQQKRRRSSCEYTTRGLCRQTCSTKCIHAETSPGARLLARRRGAENIPAVVLWRTCKLFLLHVIGSYSHKPVRAGKRGGGWYCRWSFGFVTEFVRDYSRSPALSKTESSSVQGVNFMKKKKKDEDLMFPTRNWQSNQEALSRLYAVEVT